MKQAGEITDLRLQHNFTLREGYTTIDGERIKGITYKADFTYYDKAGNRINRRRKTKERVLWGGRMRMKR